MFTIEEILKSTRARLIKGRPQKAITGVSIDSRSIKPNELFVAIRGKRFDGHNFIHQALRRGAGAILFSNACYRAAGVSCKTDRFTPLIKVKDSISALGALAHYHRMKFKIPVIAITGSNGKTTTKEMLASILSRRYNVLRNPGTENNYIGTSLAILHLRRRHQVAVIEIGANHRGEIDRLSRLIRPTAGVITNIGPSHLEFFKTLKGVLKAKLELIKNLAENGEVIINNDDRFLSQLNCNNLRKITFGLNNFSDFYAKIIKSTQTKTVFLLNGRQRIFLRALGEHNIYNALAAIACARSFKISYNEIKQALALFKAVPGRMQMLNLNNIKIINDCYNSNPSSFGYALDFLREYANQRKKVVVCGDMMELGPKAQKLHLNMGERIAKDKIDFLVTVGALSRNIARGACSAGMPRKSIRTFRNASGAARFLYKVAEDDDIVLIKGSRTMQMERVIKCFTSCSIR